MLRRTTPPFNSTAAVPKAAGCAQAGCSMGFGLVFAAFSLVFTGFAAWIKWGDWWKTRDWERVEARLESCEIKLPPEDAKLPVSEPLQFAVRYHYQYGGRELTSSRWRLQQSGGDNYEALAREQRTLREARPLYCLVNPQQPDQAVLSRRSEGLPLFIWGLMFFCVGLGIILMDRRGATASTRATMHQAAPRASLFLGGAFVSIFLAGGVFVCWQGISASLAERRVAEWSEVPCEIVGFHAGSEDRHVLYRYEVDGAVYFNDRLRPGGIRHSSDGGAFQKGQRTTCRVNPADPLEAALLAESKAWQPILFSVPFLAVGIFGWGALIYSHRKQRRRAAGRLVEKPWLSSGEARWKWIAVLLFINLFWNGIVSVFVTAASTGEMEPGGWFIWLFLSPFIVIGLVMMAMLLAKLLSLALPAARVMVRPLPLRAGEDAELSWEIAPSRLFTPHEVGLTVKAEWKDNDHTHAALPRKKPWSAVLYSGPDTAGTQTVRIPNPRSEMPLEAFERLKWQLHFRAKVPYWFDLHDAWPLELEVPEADVAPPYSRD